MRPSSDHQRHRPHDHAKDRNPQRRRIRLALVVAAVCWAAVSTSFAAVHDVVIAPAEAQLTFLLEATGHDVSGQLYLKEGKLHYDTATGAASGRIVLGAARTDTGNERRDRAMHEKVLESTLFPEIIFVPDHITGEVDDAGAGQFDLHGAITLHGDDHEVSLPTETRIDEDGRLVAHASLEVPFVEWGLEDPSLLFLRVAKVVQVDIRFSADLDVKADEQADLQATATPTDAQAGHS